MSKAAYKPDCGYAWIVVAACFTINFIMAGLVRAAGVLYVAVIDVYGVSREVATTPFSIRFCVRNLTGPLVGALGQRFGIRPIVALGGFVCGLGGILSAFAPNVMWITVAWGGIHGFGYGLCNIIHVIAINRYFHKYKALAIGISYTGDCFGTFLLPLLLDFLLETYGLKGTFLILAGVSLNAVPAAMLLRSPPWEENDAISSTCRDQEQLNSKRKASSKGICNEGFDIAFEECGPIDEIKLARNTLPAITVTEQRNNEKVDEIRPFDKECGVNTAKQTCMEYIDFYSNNKYKNHRLSDTIMLNEIYSLRESTSLRVTDKNMKKKRWSCHPNVYDTNRKNSQISVISCPSHIGKCTAETRCKNQFLHPSSAYLQSTTENGYLSVQGGNYCNQRLRRDSFLNDICSKKEYKLGNDQSQEKLPVKPVPLYEEQVLTEFEQVCEDIDKISERSETYDHGQRQQNVFLELLKINISPMFLIISATMALFVFLFISVFTIIIDYASDNNIPSEYAKYLIISFSVTDVFGRIGFGVVLDKKWLSYNYYAGLTTGLMGLLILIIPLFKNFAFWMISFSICGFVQGGTAIMFPVLVEHYMAKKESVALGSLNLYGGLLMLPIPPMIGYFRDHIGSYDGVFWTVGALCMFAGSLWIFEPYIVQKKEEKLHQKDYCTEVRKIQSNI